MGSQAAMGVISIGSNDIHLLVASSDGVATFHPRISHAVMAELVGTLQNSVLPVPALGQALHDLEKLVTLARSVEAHPILALGTEALREARNGEAFLELAATTLGIEALAITGAEEAALDYCWATFPFPPDVSTKETKETKETKKAGKAKKAMAHSHAEDNAQGILAFDSGGGSTQVVLGTGSIAHFSKSLPIGAGNLTGRWIAHDPPRREEIRLLVEHVSSLVDTLPTSATPARRIVAMGGSADHLVRFTAHPKRSLLTAEALEEVLALLQKRDASEIAGAYEIPVERARLLPAGAAIFGALLHHFGGDEMLVKEHGIRGAAVVSYARHGQAWRQDLLSASPALTSTELDETETGS
jgi:exopolyphosphatase/guanosine-5'-triphosphate,3'-diphosphate pyrophosphatase